MRRDLGLELLDGIWGISGLLARTGAPALLLGKWLEGEFELVTLVTGDTHLLELERSIPVLSPRAFLDSLS